METLPLISSKSNIWKLLRFIWLFEYSTPSLYARTSHYLAVLHTHKQRVRERERETIHTFNLYDNKRLHLFKDKLLTQAI